ncbi:hypothetical protein ACIRQP_41620 [Streptomyces sp. NPDC102274]|uniref:hypothetical protein n=1 Tax=Streptomyces sp. NPDC102274 TaxID=3366151 RepID=UPI00380C9D66
MSETPQLDPQQGSGETGPTRPLPQGTPGWGPAAHVPGQVPPPVPGQAPPPVPSQSPGAPSAWSQPVPATPPQYGAPAAGQPRGSTRLWLIGGGAALAAAVVVGVLVATSGDEGKSAAPGSPSGAPGGIAKPPAAEKAFTKAPEGCELIKASTIADIAPGAECVPSPFDDSKIAAMITRMPRWEMPWGTGGAYVGLDVSLTISSGAEGRYDMNKEVALNGSKSVRTTTDSRSVGDLGDEAHVIHAVDKEPLDLAEAQVLVREGNATIAVRYNYAPADSGKTEEQAEAAAIAAARDALGSLS